MEEMKNLKDLLVHELEDLYSAENQIIEGLPAMIEKASNRELKKSLNDHLKVTKKQVARLDKIKKLLGKEKSDKEERVFSKLFSSSEEHHCRAMEGLIEEGEKMMSENMEPEVMDAAIIAAAQKIEHYEISGYGTSKAFALQLGLRQVAELIDETLNEEYEADDLLTDLAVSDVNLDAENGEESEEVSGLKKLPGARKQASKSPAKGRASAGKRTTAKKSGSRSTSRKKSSSR